MWVQTSEGSLVNLTICDEVSILPKKASESQNHESVGARCTAEKRVRVLMHGNTERCQNYLNWLGHQLAKGREGALLFSDFLAQEKNAE